MTRPAGGPYESSAAWSAGEVAEVGEFGGCAAVSVECRSLKDGGRGMASKETVGGGALDERTKLTHGPPQRTDLV
eukprot:CAMPEP_0174723284 /NCGR_PEP_ID=MMETSP1094-20130205/40560_1 /TAXON_ID=156173 /ORGANISM="Chrysochromulina brevifilum, Strain UTEX LB 985" /LENGTH=74 /DNA_ID=CAMNT_0015924297 /DNA_START=258 /DNA_END=479 /DNA_ORIENTATION=+